MLETFFSEILAVSLVPVIVPKALSGVKSSVLNIDLDIQLQQDY